MPGCLLFSYLKNTLSNLIKSKIITANITMNANGYCVIEGIGLSQNNVIGIYIQETDKQYLPNLLYSPVNDVIVLYGSSNLDYGNLKIKISYVTVN